MSAGNASSRNYWAAVRAGDQSFHGWMRTWLYETLITKSFASFHFRSPTLPGSRRDMLRCYKGGQPVTEQIVLERLLQPYVEACGPSLTLNSLLINRQLLTGMTLRMSSGNEFEVTQYQLQQGKVLSVQLGEMLFGASPDVEEWWKGEQAWPYDDLSRTSLNSLLTLWTDHRLALGDLCRLVVGEPDQLAPTDFEVLRCWIAAIIGLKPFLKLFGPCFEVRLVPYPFLEVLRNATSQTVSDAMRSAFTLIQPMSTNLLTVEEAPFLPANLNSLLQLNGEVYRESVSASMERARRLGIPVDERLEGYLKQLPDLACVLEMAQALAGRHEEGRPLSFIVLCGNETEVLREHQDEHGGGGDRWRLKRVLQLRDPRGENEQGDITDEGIKVIVREIEKNAGLLQFSGRALFFGPTDWYPDAIVDMSPFDPSRELDIIRNYTKDGGVAIFVDKSGVAVFAGGSQILSGKGDPITWKAYAAVGDTLADEVTRNAQAMWPDLGEVEHTVIATIAAVALRVRERGHGCLLFLARTALDENGKRVTSVQYRPMAKLWFYGTTFSKDAHRVGDVDFLAAAAGMDGETFVDLATGAYYPRLEHIVPEGKWFSLHELANGQLTVSGDWEPYERQMPNEAVLRTLGQLEALGTRHMKALRITRAYADAALAITVSSNGPLRLWKGGYAIYADPPESK